MSTNRGSTPVIDFMLEQPADARARMQKSIDFFEKHGLKLLGTHYLKKLHGCELYELRIRFNKIAYRIIFSVVNKVAWLLHAFKKTSNGTPQRHIETALNRAKNIAI